MQLTFKRFFHFYFIFFMFEIKRELLESLNVEDSEGGCSPLVYCHPTSAAPDQSQEPLTTAVGSAPGWGGGGTEGRRERRI